MSRRLALGFAAMLLAVLGVTAPTPDGWLGAWYTYTTPKGASETVTLAEGSHIELNTDTKVRVHLNRWWRKIELMRGVAFFTVIHDAARPFEVKAGEGSIRDLGTAFVVHREPSRVRVAVLEGRVRVRAQESRELSAGQRVAYTPSGLLAPVEQADVAVLTAWRQGQLIFRGHRLEEVLAELGRYHDTNLLIRDPVLSDLRVSGVFRTQDLASVLNAIELTLPVRTRYLGARRILIEPAD